MMDDWELQKSSLVCSVKDAVLSSERQESDFLEHDSRPSRVPFVDWLASAGGDTEAILLFVSELLPWLPSS